MGARQRVCTHRDPQNRDSGWTSFRPQRFKIPSDPETWAPLTVVWWATGSGSQTRLVTRDFSVLSAEHLLAARPLGCSGDYCRGIKLGHSKRGVMMHSHGCVVVRNIQSSI